MNARKVQIDFDEAAPVAQVDLQSRPHSGARSAAGKDMNLGSKPGHTIAGAIQEEAARSKLFLTGEDFISRHARPVRWGINE